MSTQLEANRSYQVTRWLDRWSRPSLQTHAGKNRILQMKASELNPRILQERRLVRREKKNLRLKRRKKIPTKESSNCLVKLRRRGFVCSSDLKPSLIRLCQPSKLVENRSVAIGSK